jgi:choice-of-anchor A domain-containing protein
MLATTTVPGDRVNLGGRQALTVTGATGTNVLDVTGIELSGRSTLIFSAPAGAQFIINNSGEFEVSGSASILLQGGLTPYDVVFNQTSREVQFLGDGNVFGILLAPTSDIHLKGNFTGELIGGQSETIEVVGNTNVLHPTPATLF